MNKFTVLPFLFDLTIGVYDPATERLNLPPLNADPDYVTVAGFSSGAAMSNQIHVVHSAMFKGAAMYGGELYSYVTMER